MNFYFCEDQWGSKVGWGITSAFETFYTLNFEKFGYVSFALSAIKFIPNSQKVMCIYSMEAQEVDFYVETNMYYIM